MEGSEKKGTKEERNGKVVIHKNKSREQESGVEGSEEESDVRQILLMK